MNTFKTARPYDTPLPRVQTVSELTRSIRGLLESSYPFVTVLGQISNLRRPHSGHCYFTLKDEEAQLRAVLFKTQLRYLEQPPQDGMEVLCRGRLSVYEARGEYQLVVDFLSARGAGELQIAFEHLKKRLSEEGLFDVDRKRPLPFLPRKIGVVTSPSGAALFDFLKVAGARFAGVPIEVYPARVQGEGAAEEIVRALTLVNQRKTVEVVVLCRGGGSLEDLWPFNEEGVARAIFQSQVPVVSAVGHEIDLTIADLVADRRAPTPSAAAEAVLPDRRALICKAVDLEERLGRTMQRRISEAGFRLELHRRLLRDPSSLLTHFLLVLDHAQERLLSGMESRLQRHRSQLAAQTRRLLEHNPRQSLWEQGRRTGHLAMRLQTAMERRLNRERTRLEKGRSLLQSISPLAVLKRGYAIVRAEATGEVVRRSDQVQPGERLAILLHQGELKCEVERVREVDATGE